MSKESKVFEDDISKRVAVIRQIVKGRYDSESSSMIVLHEPVGNVVVDDVVVTIDDFVVGYGQASTDLLTELVTITFVDDLSTVQETIDALPNTEFGGRG